MIQKAFLHIFCWPQVHNRYALSKYIFHVRTSVADIWRLRKPRAYFFHIAAAFVDAARTGSAELRFHNWTVVTGRITFLACISVKTVIEGTTKCTSFTNRKILFDLFRNGSTILIEFFGNGLERIVIFRPFSIVILSRAVKCF